MHGLKEFGMSSLSKCQFIQQCLKRLFETNITFLKTLDRFFFLVAVKKSIFALITVAQKLNIPNRIIRLFSLLNKLSCKECWMLPFIYLIFKAYSVSVPCLNKEFRIQALKQHSL